MAGRIPGGTHSHGVLRLSDRWTRWQRRGPLDGRPVVVLSHGAGAGQRSPFMVATRDGLLARGCTVVSLTFCYMQRAQDEERRRPPEPMPVLLQTLELLLAKVEQGCQHLPAQPKVLLVGKSMGGRVGSMLLAEGRAPSVTGAVYLGYPLHPAGKPERLRRDHLPQIQVPQLFISGTKDTLATAELMDSTMSSLGPSASLHWIEGGDHSLALRRSAPLEGADLWLDLIADFAGQLPAR
ncbi:MAG: putative alpha/beta-hydrolase family hydrolase [Pseudohongiellaceae bacterium]|jgi:predicted alpha/beta-hydrolase family hydrolase